MRKKTPHSSCRRGKRVLVILRDGTEIIDKFVERTGKFVILENHKFTVDEIRSFAIYKHQLHNS